MRQIRRNVPLLIGLLLMLLIVAVAVVPLIVRIDPERAMLSAQVGGLRRLPPFAPGVAGFRWGSDQAGRDVFARIIYGVRYTVPLALGMTAVRVALAIPLGLLAGWYRGLLRGVIGILNNGLGAIPSLVLVSFILAALRSVVPGERWFWTYAIVVTLIGLPRIAEQVRRLTEELVNRPHVEAAISLGARPARILRLHVLPLMRGELLITLSTEIAWVLMMMGQLSIFGIYLGGVTEIGREPPSPPLIVERTPEWGQMIGANMSAIRTSPWMSVAPAIALGLTIMAFQLIAEGLRRDVRRG